MLVMNVKGALVCEFSSRPIFTTASDAPFNRAAILVRLIKAYPLQAYLGKPIL